MSNKLIKEQPNNKKANLSKTRKVFLAISAILTSILSSGAAALFAACKWVKQTFNVGLSAIINTIFSPLKGTSSDSIMPGIKFGLPYVLIALVVSLGIAIWNIRQNRGKMQKIIGIILPVFGLICLLGAGGYVQSSYDIWGYMTNKNQETSLYAENYVDPRSVSITDRGNKRNLIYIYLESMENTYADTESGGRQDINYIPNLTQLARENVSFSPTDQLGGFMATDGAGWTMGALFATTSGVPFEFPVGNNDMGQQEYFASGIYNLGDFLHDQGYTQEFMCGSDASFAGRKKYMKQHGEYKIFDLKTARKKGYIPSDYYTWWGFEDYRLYEMAKDEVTRLAQKEEPFNFTMLTVDTHHIGGYVCDKCPDSYDDQTANIVACADSLVGDFIEWCKQQDFYDTTTIVITGDHPRMDNCLVDGASYNDRLVYNCYINSQVEPAGVSGRLSTGMDVFPTVLSAMGYEIEGNRLGLGTNLFSGEETLVERMGIDALNTELMKSSKFYIENFAPELLHLVEDTFGALNMVYLYGDEYNADDFITDGVVIPQGIAAWVVGDQISFDIPVEAEDGQVDVTLHVQETFQGNVQSYIAVQNGENIAERTVPGNSVSDFTAQVKDGHCIFTLQFPQAVSPHEIDASSLDENKYSLLLKSITVN